MRILLVPGNNSLSHLSKCLAIESSLASRGHEVVVAVGRRNAGFLDGRNVAHRIFPDIQEIDQSGFPTVAWFRKPDRIAGCIAEEVDLIRRIRPDVVLGVFRFTTRASARLAGVPYDSLICGCMLPGCPDVLGFTPGEAGIDLQRYYLDSFFRYAGAKTSAALKSLGLPAIVDIRSMLEGDRTYLWDFPEFLPLPDREDVTHVGPITWNGWGQGDFDPDQAMDGRLPLAVVTSGTCVTSAGFATRIIRILLEMGFRVVLAAGGQDELLQVTSGDPRVAVCRFPPLQALFPRAALTVCHGGQVTLFESLSHGTPAFVMPFQPEQAHNALCLERLGCGSRLVAPQPFRGNPDIYIEAFNRREDDEVKSTIRRRIDDPRTGMRLAAAREIIGRYDGVAKLTSLIEANRP